MPLSLSAPRCGFGALCEVYIYAFGASNITRRCMYAFMYPKKGTGVVRTRARFYMARWLRIMERALICRSQNAKMEYFNIFFLLPFDNQNNLSFYFAFATEKEKKKKRKRIRSSAVNRDADVDNSRVLEYRSDRQKVCASMGNYFSSAVVLSAPSGTIILKPCFIQAMLS